jgi:hypothetical protein
MDLRNYPVFYTATFAAPATEFFSAVLGPVRRFEATGCTSATLSREGYGVCMSVLAETGFEAATGFGAARALVTKVTLNAFEPFFNLNFSGGSSALDGRILDLSQPAGQQVTGASIQYASGRSAYDVAPPVRRSTSLTTGLQWQTWDPTNGAQAGFAAGAAQVLFPTARNTPSLNCLPQLNGFCYQEGSIPFRFTELTAASTVPEPSTWALLGTGLLTLGAIAARRRERADG